MSSFKAGHTGDMPVAGKKSTISKGGAGNMGSADSPGCSSGLSARSPMNVNENAPGVDFKRNALTGNAAERIKPRKYDSASKNGKKFEIES